MSKETIIVKSGGDVASGIIQKLHRSGFNVLVLEINNPTSIRRTVCFSEAVFNGKMTVEDTTAVLVNDLDEIHKAWAENSVPVIVDPVGSYISLLKPIAVIDAIIAKKNLGMKKDLAPITIGIGPGFEAGKDVDIVIESNRGHNLGKLIFKGYAESNTGNPGDISGLTFERVLYAPCEGIFISKYNIGDRVNKGDIVAIVNEEPIYAKIHGIIRGLIRNKTHVTNKLKVGDIDPRLDEINNCFTISDKARAIGGGVLEAIMIGIRKENKK